jgi:hypothetical protein
MMKSERLAVGFAVINTALNWGTLQMAKKGLTAITLSQVEVDKAGRIVIRKPALAKAIKTFLKKQGPNLKANDEVGTLSGWFCSNQTCK